MRMGRKETLETGGDGGLVAFEGASFSASEEPFVSVSKVTPVFSLPTSGVGAGKPETVGGGSSRPSAAFRESWRAKSLACHHSRNLSAKIDVGSRIFRLDRSLGYTVRVSVLGLSSVVGAGGAPGLGAGGLDANSKAWWSAALRRRIRAPINQRKGEEYFVLSKRYKRLNASSEK